MPTARHTTKPEGTAALPPDGRVGVGAINWQQRLTPHFTLGELLRSQTAARLGLDNTPGQRELENLTRLALMLEWVRDAVGGVAIHVSSGLRMPAVNAAAGSGPNSLHIAGCAADFTAPAYGDALAVMRAILAHARRRKTTLPELGIEELIFEGTWVHLGIVRTEGARAAGRVLQAVFRPGQRTSYIQFPG